MPPFRIRCKGFVREIFFDVTTRRLALAAALAHAAIAAAYVVHGVSIRHDFGPSTWDFFWQTRPTEALRDRALQSLWHLHAQPPLWNALNTPLIKLFGAF